MRVLVVDDEPSVREVLERILKVEGFDVALAADGREAVQAQAAAPADAVLLDVLMPGIDGLEVCRRMRGVGDRTPVLMLTARDGVGDRVAGLEAGADDYLLKPFAVEELLARLAAIERRGRPWVDLFTAGTLRLDVGAHEARRDGRAVPLTLRETAMLELLMRHPRTVVSREHAVEEVWSGAAVDNVVDRCVMSLRRKLGDPQLIRTVRGVGFVLEP
jgi:two-component system response regulator MprA